MRLARLATVAAVLLGFAASLRSSEARAQEEFSHYALLAADGINANGLALSGGDVAVLDGYFSSSHELAASASRIAARVVRLDARSSCGALLATASRGASGTCGPATPFTPPFASVADACSFPDTFPACDPLHAPVVVPHGGTVVLTPGVYGDVRVEGGAGGAGTLVLSGTYAICNLRASRGGQIAFRGPSTLYVTESLTGSNAARIGPEPGSGVSLGQVHLLLPAPPPPPPP